MSGRGRTDTISKTNSSLRQLALVSQYQYSVITYSRIFSYHYESFDYDIFPCAAAPVCGTDSYPPRKTKKLLFSC